MFGTARWDIEWQSCRISEEELVKPLKLSDMGKAGIMSEMIKTTGDKGPRL